MNQLTFSDKRKQWLEAVNGNDRHSIHTQLTQMAWDAASFAVINEARRLAPVDSGGVVKLNGMMHRLVNRTFLITQSSAIRRLVDVYELEGKRGVFSLTGLLDDMMKHRHLMTRQAIFDAEDLAYDYEPIRAEAEKYYQEQTRAGNRSFEVPEHLWWRKHASRHEQIDRLSGTEAKNRKPEDTVCETVFSHLRNKATVACEDVKNYVDKFIAHSATPGSRALASADEINITLNHLEEARRNLCEIVSFLTNYILGDSCGGFLPIPQYNQFKYIEEPLVSKIQITKLSELWSRLDRCDSAMSNWGLDEYESEVKQRVNDLPQHHC